jgi:hypothetical protein
LTRYGRVLLLLSVALVGCQRQQDGDLREAYDRMMAQAERREAERAAQVQPDEPPPAPVAVDTAPAGLDQGPRAELPVEAEDTAVEEVPGVVERPHRGIPPAVQRDLRVGQHGEFDRLVFEFDGPALPGYHVEYVDRPVRECGTGNPVAIEGDGWLRVRLEPARAHEFVGETARVTVADRNRSVQMGVVRQVRLTCDFEAQVEWVIGVTSPNRYRVQEMYEPTRLVVDVLLE